MAMVSMAVEGVGVDRWLSLSIATSLNVEEFEALLS
jgi:hypothetical protein